MEFTKAEIFVVEQVAKKVGAPIQELGELQLALIGGGSGDVIFA
jgi:hypothetical protein